MAAHDDGILRAILGPTNTGKTHLAIERMCAHSSGVIGFPLRLLAREVYGRVVALCAQTQESVRILFNSATTQDAGGLANSSGMLGKYLMTHFSDSGASGEVTDLVETPSMGDANLHNHRRCPLIFLGKANGALEGNIHLRAPKGTPMANPMLSLMQAIGHDDMNGFGDSTGEFPLKYAVGATSQEGM